MSIPIAWVDKIFLKLTLVYGRDFIGRWEGLEISDVKTDWGHELSGFEDWPEAIAHALAALPPGKPPTVLEFRDLARKAPRKSLVELPGPPADPVKVAAELAKLAQLTARKKDSTGRDEKAWVKRLIARHEAGDTLRPIQLRFAREALRIKAEAA
jgi:hypothetical protein